MNSDRPTGAPAHFPYAHRTVAEVMREEEAAARRAILEIAIRNGDLIARERLRDAK